MMDAPAYFRTQARECRRLARGAQDRTDQSALLILARHYDREVARSLEPVQLKSVPH